MQHDIVSGGDRDLLLGAAAITDFINSLLDADTQVTKQVVYVWIAREHIPVKRIGARIIASKAALRRHLFPVPPAG